MAIQQAMQKASFELYCKLKYVVVRKSNGSTLIKRGLNVMHVAVTER
jgi:hypothetical protein